MGGWVGLVWFFGAVAIIVQTWVLGIELRSPWSQEKCFADWAISAVQNKDDQNRMVTCKEQAYRSTEQT